MSERKVLNKYYPPDFDPTKLPKLKQGRNRQFVIRIMAPFSMRCKTCGEYIYKGRKFNSRMETVENETYLGLRIYRFYIRCTKCISEITFKTDPENTDYVMENGATRNFEAFKKLSEQIAKEKLDKDEEEANNPMKALENRTRDSKREMESIEKLEELKDLNTRLAKIDHDKLILNHLKEEAVAKRSQEEEDEYLVKQIFGGGSSLDGYVKRIIDSDDDDDDRDSVNSDFGKRKATDYLTDHVPFTSDMPGPSMQPAKKTKLKTPFDDLSSMVRLKTNEKQEKVQELPPILPVPETVTEIKKEVPKPIELKPLPEIKITLKKNLDNSDLKMKGASLNILGGYGSTSDESD
ncbi:splicing factor YJU2 isoform X1 [Hydra vulgaris]|uniref:Splicing factor YJU2 n=1 Tax=Hydra vulgaris TaxID=6087 RepID=T2M6S6_HYDVU|nr:splicing factor YJU2 [Hydra vulgaris]